MSESDVHKLRTVLPFFEDVRSGRKTFEVRRNDRNFYVGDILELIETFSLHGFPTGNTCRVRVTYILYAAALSCGIKDGYVVMGIQLI